VLMALLRRTQTGRGDYIDISMYDSMVSACVNVLGPAMSEGRQQIARHERTTGGAAFYRIYRTSDDRYLTLAGQEEKFVRNLLNAAGRQDFIDLCLRGPGPHQAPVIAYFDEWFRSKPLARWIEWLLELDVCFGPVQTFPEMLADPQLRARGMVVTDGGGRKHISSPIRFGEEKAEIDLRIPALGQDTEVVTRGLRQTPEAGAHDNRAT
jgi:crotonobetainyl-CoA:carnitine CoA-transferase CaiB-like acyl-CoA transferase